MMGVIDKDVCDGIHQLRRRAEKTRMVMVGEHAPPALHQAIQRFCDAHLHTLHASRERHVRIRLYEQVQVVPEDREFDDAEAKPLASAGKSLFDDAKAPSAAEIPDVTRYAQGDQHRGRFLEPRSRLVRDERAWALGLPAGPLPPSTSLRQFEFELPHLIGDRLPEGSDIAGELFRGGFSRWDSPASTRSRFRDVRATRAEATSSQPAMALLQREPPRLPAHSLEPRAHQREPRHIVSR